MTEDDEIAHELRGGASDRWGGEHPLLPLRNQVLFPGSDQVVEVAREKSVALTEAIAESIAGDVEPILVAFVQRDPATDDPGLADLHPVGVAARVLECREDSSGNTTLTMRGLARVRLDGLVQENPFLAARVSVVDDPQDAPRDGADRVAEPLGERLVDLADQLVPPLPAEVRARLGHASVGRRADLLADHLDVSVVSVQEKAALLELPAAQRVPAVHALVTRQLEHQRRRAEVHLPTPSEQRQLWPMELGAEERTARMREAGAISEDEARRILEFSEKGYTVWEGLVEPELVDALVSDVRGIREHPGYFLTTDHRRGRTYRFSGPDFDAFESIFDLYVNFESARRVCFHPTILRFLELVFEARPVAIQQLLFQRSNAHPLHQDTAFVCVAQPLLMAATWVALEDVVRGRGELTYFEGSHRIPQQIFRDGSRRFDPALDDAEEYGRVILDRCHAQGCRKRDFLARKGDVFFWAADLVHGSNPRTRPEEETRMACVTHYCPETTYPLWFWLQPDHRESQGFGDRARYVSTHYRLPCEGGLVRPRFRLPLPC